MPRGGKRPGAGRKAPGGAKQRSLTVRLDASGEARLVALRAKHGLSAGEVVHRALAEMAHLWGIAALALLLAACQPAPEQRIPPPYAVYVAAGMQRSVTEDVQESAADWNAKLGTEALVWQDGSPEPDACGVVLVAWRTPWDRPREWQAFTDLSAPCVARVWLNPAGFWDTTLRHELGHVLGLRYDLEPDGDDGTVSIMTHGTLDREITPADVAAVKAVWGW